MPAYLDRFFALTTHVFLIKHIILSTLDMSNISYLLNGGDYDQNKIKRGAHE